VEVYRNKARSLRDLIPRWRFHLQIVILCHVIETVRRISAVILTLVLVLGPAGCGVYASLGGVNAAVITVSGDGHSHGKCGDCGANGAVPAAPCSSGAFCGGFAVPAVSHFMPEPLSADQAPAYEPHHLTGRADAPDPYPPRSTILS
jgi:hypothetical protein